MDMVIKDTKPLSWDDFISKLAQVGDLDKLMHVCDRDGKMWDVDRWQTLIKVLYLYHTEPITEGSIFRDWYYTLMRFIPEESFMHMMHDFDLNMQKGA